MQLARVKAAIRELIPSTACTLKAKEYIHNEEGLAAVQYHIFSRDESSKFGVTACACSLISFWQLNFLLQQVLSVFLGVQILSPMLPLALTQSSSETCIGCFVCFVLVSHGCVSRRRS